MNQETIYHCKEIKMHELELLAMELEELELLEIELLDMELEAFELLEMELDNTPPAI